MPEIPKIRPETTSFVTARTPRDSPPKSEGRTGTTSAGVIAIATDVTRKLRFFLYGNFDREYSNILQFLSCPPEVKVTKLVGAIGFCKVIKLDIFIAIATRYPFKRQILKKPCLVSEGMYCDLMGSSY